MMLDPNNPLAAAAAAASMNLNTDLSQLDASGLAAAGLNPNLIPTDANVKQELNTDVSTVTTAAQQQMNSMLAAGNISTTMANLENNLQMNNYMTSLNLNMNPMESLMYPNLIGDNAAGNLRWLGNWLMGHIFGFQT